MPDEKGHIEYVTDIHDARRRLGDLIAGAPQASHDPPRMILEHDGIARFGDLQTLVAATYHYRDIVNPVGREMDHWSSELGRLFVPIGDGRGVEWKRRTYSLADLTRFRGVSVDLRVDAPGRSRGARTVTRKAFLPPAVCRRVYIGLNEIVQTLNLGIRVDPPDASDDPPEPPEHVKELAPGFGGDDGDGE